MQGRDCPGQRFPRHGQHAIDVDQHPADPPHALTIAAAARWEAARLHKRSGAGDLGAVVGGQVVQGVVLGLPVAAEGERFLDGGGIADDGHLDTA